MNSDISIIDNSELTDDDRTTITSILDKFRGANYESQFETVKLIAQQSQKVMRALLTVMEVSKDYLTDNTILGKIVEEYKRKNGPLDPKYMEEIRKSFRSFEVENMVDDELYNKIQIKNKELRAIKAKVSKRA